MSAGIPLWCALVWIVGTSSWLCWFQVHWGRFPVQVTVITICVCLHCTCVGEGPVCVKRSASSSCDRTLPSATSICQLRGLPPVVALNAGKLVPASKPKPFSLPESPTLVTSPGLTAGSGWVPPAVSCVGVSSATLNWVGGESSVALSWAGGEMG